MKNLLLAALLFSCSYLTSKANTWYVTNASDTGTGSLRAAMDSANNHAGFDSIVLQLTAHDTIYPGSALPGISDSLVISGMPCQNPTISGNSVIYSTSPISVADSTIFLALNNLNVFNCHTVGSQAYGAVYGGQLYVNHCFFYGSIYDQSAGNPSAGAICAASVWAYNSTFSADSCLSFQFSAGALRADSAHLFNCTFYGNYSIDYGGAINADYLEMQNCTVAANSASSGGGIYSNYPGAGTVVANSIIWGNTISSTGSNVLPGIQFSSSNVSGGCNILQDTASVDSFHTVSSDITGVNPQFGTFGYYSGCVPVLPIMCGSIAQNHASCAGATDTDAQGLVAQGVRDAGAFETSYPHLYSDSLDSIEPGTTADLYNYFNTTGLTIQWPDTLNDSTAQYVDTGTYTITGTNFLGCSDTASITIIYATDTALGIANTDFSNTIKLFPNPASDKVTITWVKQIKGPMLLKVTDMLSKEVLAAELNGQAGNFTFPISKLSPGAYCVRLTDNLQNCRTTKLIVIGR